MLYYTKCQGISFSKKVITYINLTVSNVPNDIIKQYYSIIKAIKVLVIAKKTLKILMSLGDGHELHFLLMA